MPDMRSPVAPSPPGQAAPDELVDTVLAAIQALVAVAARSLAASRRRRAELARLLGALPPDQHEPVIAAFRGFGSAAGELPQPGAALGWAGP